MRARETFHGRRFAIRVAERARRDQIGGTNRVDMSQRPARNARSRISVKIAVGYAKCTVKRSRCEIHSADML